MSTAQGWISVPTPALTEGGGTESTTITVTVDPSHSSVVVGTNSGSVTLTPQKNNGRSCSEGATSLPVTLTITADTTAPTASCGSADSSWHADNISISCTASDSGSGLAASGDASFSLSTSVVDGAENANASTGSRSVCDNAGNCVTAGPTTGNKIDRKAPTAITFVGLIANGASFEEGLVPPAPTCNATDGGSGLHTCVVTGYSSAVGNHTLTATATDAVGNADTATRSYTVTAAGPGDTTSPSIACGSGDSSWHADNISISCTASDSESGLVTSGDASFSLSTSVVDGAENGNASTGSRSVCDNAGNCVTAGPITGNKIDRNAPTLISFADITDGASYSEDAVPPGATCSATDGGSGLGSCVVTGYSAALGTHTLTATATDQVGNVNTATIGYTVTKNTVTQDTVTQDTVTQDTVTQDTVTQDTVTQDTVTQDTVTQDTVPLGDRTSPETFIDSGPEGSISLSSATFTYSGHDGGASDPLTFECRMDGSAFTACPSTGMTYAALEEGSHTFEVRATDASGNVDQTPASRTFVIDESGPDVVIDAPDTVITSGPRGTITERSVTFTYSQGDGLTSGHEEGSVNLGRRVSSTSENAVAFECRLDDGSFMPCPSSGISYAGLADGTHRFQVRGIDEFGNADATPAARTFEVDATEVLGKGIVNDSLNDSLNDSPNSSAGDRTAGARERKALPFTGARLQALIVFALLSMAFGVVLTRWGAHGQRVSIGATR